MAHLEQGLFINNLPYSNTFPTSEVLTAGIILRCLKHIHLFDPLLGVGHHYKMAIIY